MFNIESYGYIKIDLVILLNDVFFDTKNYNIVKDLCDKFQGLRYELKNKYIHVFGSLLPHKYEEYKRIISDIAF